MPSSGGGARSAPLRQPTAPHATTAQSSRASTGWGSEAERGSGTWVGIGVGVGAGVRATSRDGTGPKSAR